MKITYRFQESYRVLTSMALLLASTAPAYAAYESQDSVSIAEEERSLNLVQERIPDQVMPETETPGQNDPDEAAPEQSQPDQSPPEVSRPDQEAPEQIEPDLAPPEQSAPETSPPDKTAVNRALPETNESLEKNTEISNTRKTHKHRGIEFVLPGQKLRISGFAEKQEPSVVAVSTTSQEQPASYHRAQMRLTGSMCFSCLLELQKKIEKIYGVEMARVEKSNQTSIQSVSPVLPNWADSQVYYDANKLDLIDLRAYIRSNGYFPYKVEDKEVNSLPAKKL